jgi:hypothetical protein
VKRQAEPVAKTIYYPTLEGLSDWRRREFNTFGVVIRYFVSHELRSGTGIPSLHSWLFIDTLRGSLH